MPLNLDLDGALRPGLDLLANEIVISLKKRSRFKQNLEIYRPGLVASYPDASLLDYVLARVERLHAELGRYVYCEQEAFSDVADVVPLIRRPPPRNPIPIVHVAHGEKVLRFYRQWIESALAPGTDSDTFGETVTSDVAVLQNIYERINYGKLVAEYKLQQDPEKFSKTGGDPEAIRSLIVHKEREKRVLELHEHLARHYEFDVDQIRWIVEWVIAVTIEVQIKYIQFRQENSQNVNG